jgi:hypothetical protein
VRVEAAERVDAALKGKKVYTIAADYNFGQISAEWNRKLVKEQGGTVVGEEFIPLGVSQFAQTIQNIQKAKPDWLMSLVVGNSQSSFYEQAPAAGLKIPMGSSITIGLGFEHKHLPETQLYSKLTRRPIFVPSVGNYRQGMLVSVPLHLDTLTGKPSGADLHAALAKRYAGSKYVSVMPLENAATKGGRIEPEALNETNKLELYVFASEKHRQAVLVARLDNLGKGASGAAVQNMRLMLGLADK